MSGAADQGDVLDRRSGLTTDMERRINETRGMARETTGENSIETWGVRNCAEVRACNRLVANGEQIADLEEMHTVDLRTWSDAPRCRNCRLTTIDVDRAAVTSDPTDYPAFSRNNPIIRDGGRPIRNNGTYRGFNGFRSY